MSVATPKLASWKVSPDSTRPLPEPILTHHQWVLWHSPRGNSTGNAQDLELQSNLLGSISETRQIEKFECFGQHDDVIKWKHFPRYWPFVRGIHRWPLNSPHKSQWRGALMFSFICAWIDGHLSKKSWGWWFETPSHPLWHHCNETSSVSINMSGYSKLCRRQYLSKRHITFVTNVPVESDRGSLAKTHNHLLKDHINHAVVAMHRFYSSV